MPGMMDTVLNLGLNDEVVDGLSARSGERFAYDSYRRFIDMFGGVVSVDPCYRIWIKIRCQCCYCIRLNWIPQSSGLDQHEDLSKNYLVPLLLRLQVMGVSHSLFEHELESLKTARGVHNDTDLTTQDLKELVQKYKSVYRNAIGKDFPTGIIFLFWCFSKLRFS